MKIFAESPVCAVARRLILVGNPGKRGGSTPDYSILSRHTAFISAMISGKRCLISKEEVGISSKKVEFPYDVCPTSSTYDMVRPVFLIRDPIQLFDSWKHSGRADEQRLIEC
jgi:hypothetical protein